MNREVSIDSEDTTDVISIQQLKDWGKIPSGAEDHLIDQIIKSVRQLQEEWTGRSFILKTLTVNWEKADFREIELPFGPIRTITSIKRVYEDGTLSSALTEGTDFYLSGMDFQTVHLYTRWQSAGKIITGLRATYTCGHGTGTGLLPLPEPIIGTMWRHVTTDILQRDDLEVYQPVLYDWVKEALQPYVRDNLWL